MDEKALNILKKAKVIIITKKPFFAGIILRHKFVEDNKQETAWIDGKEIGYNSDFILSLSFPEVVGLLCHEILHIALNHHTRRGKRDSKKWNEAGDYAINNILIDEKIELPEGALIGYKNKSTEQIYTLLPEEKESKNKLNPFGEVRDFPGTPEEVKTEQEQIKETIAQSNQISKKRGKGSTNLDRLTKTILEPKINWVNELREYVEIISKNDYSWITPNRRYISSGIFLPSLNSINDLGEIVVAIDTSGSVSDVMIKRFASEISSILENYKCKITIIYCDFSIRNIQEVSNDDLPLILNAKGGGGTDFIPVFNYVEAQELTPKVLVYLTDLYGRFPVTSPDYPVIWVNTGSEGNIAPFGKTIFAE